MLRVSTYEFSRRPIHVAERGHMPGEHVDTQVHPWPLETLLDGVMMMLDLPERGG